MGDNGRELRVRDIEDVDPPAVRGNVGLGAVRDDCIGLIRQREMVKHSGSMRLAGIDQV